MSKNSDKPEPAGSLRRQAEERALKDAAETREPLPPEKARQMLHELRVHQIELEMQNEELHRVQENLEASRARYFDLYDLAPVGYLTLCAKGLVQEANLTAARLWGVARKDLPGNRLSRFIFSEDQDIYYRNSNLLMQTGTPQSCEVRMLNRDGGIFWARVEATLDREGETGATTCRVAVRDISERKRAEAALVESEQALRRANQELEGRVAQRTAELARTVEALDAEIGQRKRAEDDLRQSLRQMDSRAGQLRALAGELIMAEKRERRRLSQLLHDGLQQHLASAKIRLWGIADRFEHDDLKAALREIEAMIAESLKMSRGLTTDLSPPVLNAGGLSEGLQWLARRMLDKHGFSVELTVETRPELAEETKVFVFDAVRELLFNAVKHAGTSSARVRLWREKAAGLRVVVSDAGVGFDPSRLAPPGDSGGGFGLFSIRERIALIGGSLEVESAPGEGSRFTLTVPRRPRSVPQPFARGIFRATGRLEAKTPAGHGSNIRVLLADDHALFRDGVDRLLERQPGIQVVGHARDGQEAVELARRLRPDVVLMDIGMPRVDGMEATRVIHREDPQIRVIGLSMHEDPEHARLMAEAGAADFMTKGCAADELVSAIRGRSSQQPSQAGSNPAEDHRSSASDPNA